MSRKLAILAILGFAFLTSSQAQDVEGRLAQIAGRLEAANSLFKSDNGLNMTELSRLAVELESIMAEMREVSRDYGRTRKEFEDRFKSQSKEFSEVLGYMATMLNAPAPDFLLHPEGALGAIQANMIVGSVVPQLEDKVAGIAAELGYLRDLAEREELLKASTKTAVDQINLLRKQIVDAERSGETRVVRDPEVLDALFAVSDNLTDFVRGLQQLPLEGPAPASFIVRDSKGAWAWPASGEKTNILEGAQIETLQKLIISPVPGTVRFADEFLDYGQTVIIEPQKGYLLILAGFDELIVREGDIIAAGDLVGYFFDKNSGDSSQTSNSILENDKRKLYVELRKNGVAQPLDEYFATSE